MSPVKLLLRWVLQRCYRIELKGQEHLSELKDTTIVVANHTSFLDALLIYAFLPIPLTFAVNTHIAKGFYLKLIDYFIKLFPLDPAHPLSLRKLIHHVNDNHNVVIFPEGRITVTGSLMKIYHGPGMVAVKTQAQVLPVCIDGAQYTPFSRLSGKVRRRLFPHITLTLFEPRVIQIDEQLRGREKREKAGKILSDIMTEMVFEASDYKTSLFDQLLDARKVHGGSHVIAEDIQRVPLTYDSMITKSLALGKAITAFTKRGEHVGVLLPGALSNLVTFWGLHIYGRIPAMLNYTAGAAGMISACETAQVKTVICARAFVIKGKLDDVINAMEKKVTIVYLEDVAKQIDMLTKLRSYIISKFDWGLKGRHRRNGVDSNSPAVILFTSGSEGTPKAVVLTHQNILANIRQLASRIDFNNQDIALNALPLFHCYGLTAGTLLPVLYGLRTFLYPSPLHYRIIPEVAYDISATILYGTNTFLAGYAKYAHPYDFYSIRYVFAGAEKLKEEVRREWENKFGVRIFEGYGATETSPVLSMNTPMDNKPGSVGRLLPNVRYKLMEIEGLSEGKRLHVTGPNIMKGYFLHENPGVLVPPSSEVGEHWYDTGDIVDIDDNGFVTICGRAKRFAKVGGEMISLTTVESLASAVWPDSMHAALSIPDEKKGEQIVLLTAHAEAERSELVAEAKRKGLGELNVPRKVMSVKQIPLLGTGKTDYVGAQQLLESLL